MLSAALLSAGVVAIAEIGDKTQLLAMLLAAQFRRPLIIIGGILAATLANHAAASWAGATLSGLLQGPWMALALGVSFLMIAAWALVTDRFDDGDAHPSTAFGPFATTVIAFFLAEIGDKTQVATIALAAKYQSMLAVTTGTTLGMMIANVPAVLGGSTLARRLPLKWIRIAAALVFASLGAAVLLKLGSAPR
jgi:putative Ca2+/H+ antiporter (TMEM165/GDT1 family)